MADAPVIVKHERLADFIASVLEAMKMAPKNARLSADFMVRTDLRGVDSHGIGMLPKYVEWTDLGFIDPAAEPTLVRDDLATGLVDGQKGLAIRRARWPWSSPSPKPPPSAWASWPSATPITSGPAPTTP